MPQTIDYKVNVDLNEAMSTLQMVDMQMSQLGGGGYGGGGGGYGGGGMVSNTEQAFGDLSFSAGQFVQRFQAPLGTIRTHTPASLSSMPNINLATAATSVWGSSGLNVPQGVARYDFERYAQEQFSVQGSRAAAGMAWGVGSEVAKFGVAAAGAKIGAGIGTFFGPAGTAAGGLIGGLIGGIGGYMSADAALSPATGMMQDRALMEDVVRSSSNLSAKQSRAVASSVADFHLNDPMISGSDATMIAGLGAQMGLMGDSASSSKEYLQNFRKLTKDAKEVATALGTSLQEGMATMAQLKGVGFGVGNIGGVVSQLSGMAGGDPGKIQGLIGTGMMGASAFHGTGMARTGGFWQAIGTAGAVSSAKASGDVSGEMWTQAGGASGVTRMMLGSNMQFHESGMGVAMAAGLWQGGTKMGAYSGGDAMGLMAAGVGGMGSGDFLSFNRNRAEAVGGMKESVRRQMEAKATMEMAGMWAESLGGSTEDALFAMAQGRGYSTPQAQTWASAIQRQARGGGGGGGGKKASVEAAIRRSADQRNGRHGVDAVVGAWRDKIARGYNSAIVEPMSLVQAGWAEAITEYVDTTAGVSGDADLTLMSVNDELGSQMSTMKGMDVSDLSWAGSLATELRAAKKETYNSPAAGLVQFPGGEFFAATDIVSLTRDVGTVADAAWNTDIEKVRSGRGNQASTMYNSLAASHVRHAASRSGLKSAWDEGGTTGVVTYLHQDGRLGSKRTAASLAATRAYAKDFGNIELNKDDLVIGKHQEVGVMAESGQDAGKAALAVAFGFGPRSRSNRFSASLDEIARGGGADGVVGTDDDTMTDTFRAWMKKPLLDYEAMNAGYELGAQTNAVMAVAGGVVGLTIGTAVETGKKAVGFVGGLTSNILAFGGAALALTGKDTVMEERYDAFAAPVATFLDEMAKVTPEERAEARKRPGSKAAGFDLEGAALEVSREKAMTGLHRGLAGDPSKEKEILFRGIEDKTTKQLVEQASNVVQEFKEQGGTGKKKKGKTIVPIAMGIDATDRDLYNAVASLLSSVRALHGNITAPKPDGEIKVDFDKNSSNVGDGS